MAFVCSVEPQPALMAIYCQSSVLGIYHDPGIQSLAWWYKIAMIVHSNQIVLGNRPVREEEPKFEGRNCTPFEIHAAFFRDFEPVCFCVQYCSSPGSGLFAAMVAVCSFSRRYLICQSSTRYKSHFPNFQVSRFSSGLSHAHLQCAIQDVARFQLYTHTWKDIRNTMMTWHDMTLCQRLQSVAQNRISSRLPRRRLLRWRISSKAVSAPCFDVVDVKLM